MMNPGSQDQSAKEWTAADLSHDDRLWLLGYLSKRDPAAFALALAALAGTLARKAWTSPG